MEPAVSETKEAVRPSGDLKSGVSGALRWFAASTGTIGIALYVCGFLIAVAQQHLLGIGRLVNYSHDEYVQQGGTFLYDIGTTVIIAAEPFSLILVLLAMIGAGVAFAWMRWTARHRRWRFRVRRWNRRARPFWPPTAYLVLVVLLFSKFGDWQDFGSPLTLSNILFQNPDATTMAALHPIQNWLLSDAKGELASAFEDRLFKFIGAVLLFVAAYYVTKNQQWRRPALAPFVLLAGLYTLMLPMLYGVLKVRMEFPIVMLWPNEDPKISAGQRCLLLNLTDQAAVLYSASDRKVLWRRRDRIERLDVLGYARILNEISAGKAKP